MSTNRSNTPEIDMEIEEINIPRTPIKIRTNVMNNEENEMEPRKIIFCEDMIDDDDINEDCSICLNTMNNELEILITKCDHKFHKECLENCFKNKNNNKILCPLCRDELNINEFKNMDIKIDRNSPYTNLFGTNQSYRHISRDVYSPLLHIIERVMEHTNN